MVGTVEEHGTIQVGTQLRMRQLVCLMELPERDQNGYHSCTEIRCVD
jgi:hypothetical protein